MQTVFLSIAEDAAGRLKEIALEFSLAGLAVDFYEGPFPPFDSPDAALARRAIGEKISRSPVTICLIGEDTHKSQWVDCQLRKSQQKGNKIIAMALKGVKIATLPAVIREENMKFYPWDPRRIAKLLID